MFGIDGFLMTCFVFLSSLGVSYKVKCYLLVCLNYTILHFSVTMCPPPKLIHVISHSKLVGV